MGDTITRHQGCCTKTRSPPLLSCPTLSHDDILRFSSSCVPVLQLYLGNGEPRVDGCWAEQGHHRRPWAHLEIN